MGTAIRQIALEQIANQVLYLGVTQRIIGFDGVRQTVLAIMSSPNRIGEAYCQRFLDRRSLCA